MRIVLLEFIDEAKHLLSKYGKDFFLRKDVLAVCLYPNVRVFLKSKGIEAKDTLAYLDNDAQHRIILKTEEIAKLLMRNTNLKDGFGIKRGYEEECLHHLRMYINHFLCIIEILESIKNKHQSIEFCCCLPKNSDGMYTGNVFIQNEERFLGLIARDFCKINNISFNGNYLQTRKVNPLVNFMAILVRKAAQLIILVEYRSAISKKHNNKKTIVVPAHSYNMGTLLKEIEERHPGVRRVMVMEGISSLKGEMSKIRLVLKNYCKRFKKENILDAIIFIDSVKCFFRKDLNQQNAIKKELVNLKDTINNRLKGLLSYNKVPIHFYLAEKIDRGLKNEMLNLQHNTLILHNLLKQLQPKLLMAMYSRGIYHMMGELSHYLGFYSLSISHGTHVAPNNEFEKIENYHLGTGVILNTFKNVAVQTPWANKFLDYYKDERPRLVSGPLLYAEVKKETRDKKRKEILGIQDKHRIIIHATTQKLRTGMRFHITETLDEYISGLADIVNAVNDLGDVFFILRPHPACDLSEKDFYMSLPRCNRFKIINKGSFGDVLSAGDLLISYSSTCIEEALQNRIPVILFDKWKRYNHFNIKETTQADAFDRQPAYYLTNPQLLAKGISGILDIFNTNPLQDRDLMDYKYPREYRGRFFNFVGQALESRRGN
ncbi:MAG: hypothetical protein PHY56_05715 [Candidatus Omnitrophica bacterium]|nr:hypothetical protein [Candidatus Omnitrophota bacterium]